MTESRGFVDRYAQRLAEEREEAGEHVPVSPPVDALLNLIDEVMELVGEYGRWRADEAAWWATLTPEERTRAGGRADRADLLEATHVRKLRDSLGRLHAAGVEEGRRREEASVTQVIEERDEYFEAADKLADAIADAYGMDIGEHSNANDPWQNALDAIAEAGGGRWVRAAREDGVAEGRRQATEERAGEQEASSA